jgi:hypothetical protein
MGLERDLLSLVSTTEHILGRKRICSGLENREYGRRDPSHWPRDTLYLQEVDTNFVDKLLSHSRYSSLEDSGHGVFLFHAKNEDIVQRRSSVFCEAGTAF